MRVRAAAQLATVRVFEHRGIAVDGVGGEKDHRTFGNGLRADMGIGSRHPKNESHRRIEPIELLDAGA